MKCDFLQTRILSVFNLLKRVGFAVLVLGGSNGEGRTWIVSLDGSGDFDSVQEACSAAVAGDSVFVHNGRYEYLPDFTVPSGVMVYPETHGQVTIANPLTAPNGVILNLEGSAEIIGLVIEGDPFATVQNLVVVHGGPAIIENCQFIHYRAGSQLELWCNGQPPRISNCSFSIPFGSFVENRDSTNINMPYNYYGGLTDTAFIHGRIHDGQTPPYTEGLVYISPVLDTFQWLPVGNVGPLIPDEFSIHAFPNPFNSTLSISLDLPLHQDVTLSLYDLLGREVDVIYRGRLASQTISYVAPAGLSSGVYFLRGESGDESELVKVVLLK